MSLFESLGKPPVNGGGPQAMTAEQAMRQLRANPASFMRQAGLDVPESMADPQQIVQHLMQSGQLSSPRFHPVRLMMGRR